MEQLRRILSYTLPAGRLFGIPLRINWLMLLFVPSLMAPHLAALARPGDPRFALFEISLAAAYIGVLYGSIVLHELGHCWGYRLTGVEIREIQLTPFGGLAVGEGNLIGPKSELIVVGLGPAANALLALVFGGASWGLEAAIPRLVTAVPVGVSGAVLWMGLWFLAVLRIAAGLNLALLLFNTLVPVFPLDGAKLWRAGLSLWFNPQRTTLVMARLGLWTCGALAFVWLLNVHVPLLGNIRSWSLLMLLFGVQACLELLRTLPWRDVYEAWHPGSAATKGRPLYFEGPTLEQAGATARRDLGPMAWLAGGAWNFRFRGAKGPVAVDSAGRDMPARRGAMPTETAKRARPAAPGTATAATSVPTGEIRMIAPDPATLADPVEVRKLMNAAARAEDFALAARLKKRLAELDG